MKKRASPSPGAYLTVLTLTCLVGGGFLIFSSKEPISDAGSVAPFSYIELDSAPPAAPSSTIVADTPPRRRRRMERERARDRPSVVRDTTSEVSGTTLPDSSRATPLPPPLETEESGRGRGANEPAGFHRLASRGFADAREDGWRHREGRNFEILQEPGIPGSSPYFARANYPAGWRGGVGPVMETKELRGEYRALYVSMWVRFSNNWFGHPSGSNKIFHFWIADQNKVVLKAQGNGNRPMTVMINLQGVNEQPRSRGLKGNSMSDGRITRGRWHNIEVLVRANTPGNRDGSVEWWVDGVKVGSHLSINYVRASEENTWTSVAWNPTWGGTGSNLTSSQSMDMDHIYVSGQ